jgi:hypothetical protein
MYQNDHFLALPEAVVAFAWSAPMRELASRIGISDVGLKKLLRSHGIAAPPQGHWNRVHAGKKVPGPPKPPQRGPGEIGRVRLDGRFRAHVPEAGRMPVGGPFVSALVPEDIDELRQRELASIGKVAVRRDLARPHRAIAAILVKDDKRREKYAASGWAWDLPKHDAPLARRQLRILDAILWTATIRGHESWVQEKDEGLGLTITVGAISHDLMLSRSPGRKLSENDLRTLPPSTPLRIAARRSYSDKELMAWEDGKDEKLERKIAAIVAEVIVLAEAAFRRSLVDAVEAEERHRKWLEERRLQELEKLKEKRIADLRASGDLLRQAEEIRMLVARVETAMREGSGAAISTDRIASWKRWALAQADAIDPVISGQVLAHIHVSGLDA